MSDISGGTFVRLWLHEVLRVFGDRLIEEQDQQWLLNQLKQIIPNYFDGTKIEIFLEELMKGDGVSGSAREEDDDKVTIDTLRRLLFVEFLSGEPPEGSPQGMSVGVMSVGVMSVGVMSVGVMLVTAW
jgi:hypothetical protein